MQITKSFQKAMDKAKINLTVIPYRKYGDGRSAGFELRDSSSEEVLFTMDVDVNRPTVPTKIYEISDLRFRGVASAQMIADKVFIVSSDKVFRRIKDVVDLYYISRVCDFNREEILNALKNAGRDLGNFDGFLNREEELKYSYSKFRFAGGVNKPTFEEVYQMVKSFIADAIE
jgi:hypothetical protein